MFPASSSVSISAAARQSSNLSAANPRSGFVAHSHTLACYAPTRVNSPPHAYTYDARPDKQLFISSIEQFRPQKWPLAPVFIEEFAINNIVNTPNVSLKADGKALLLGLTETSKEQSSSSSSSSNLGVTVYANGSFDVNASATQTRGQGAGNSTTTLNTYVGATQKFSIETGGDFSLVGAEVRTPNAKVDIGGNLNIISPQNTSTYSETSKTSGGSFSAGSKGLGASATQGNTNINSNTLSTGNTSGIFTGDEGFQLNVKGDVKLQGGQITSTDKAIQDGKNIYNVGGTTTTIDLQNNAQYSASASSATVGIGSEVGKTGGGIGNASGQASSVTLAGVSGQAGHQEVRTGDKSAAIAPIFDLGSVKQDIDAQVQITKAFINAGAQSIGKYGQDKTKPITDARNYQDAKAKPENQRSPQEKQFIADLEKTGYSPEAAAAALADPKNIEDYNNWKEGGSSHAVAHGLLGALTGGLGGAAGALSSQALVNNIAGAVAGSDLPTPVKEALIVSASALAGAATGGTSGAMSAVNATANNYLSHIPPGSMRLSEKEQYERAVAECGTGNSAACQRRDDLAQMSAQRDRDLQQACGGATPQLCDIKTKEARDMGNIVTVLNGNVVIANSPESGAIRNLNVATIGAPPDPRTGTFHDSAARSTAEALLVESGNQAALAVLNAALKGVGVTANTVKGYFASSGIKITDDVAAKIADGAVASSVKTTGGNGGVNPALLNELIANGVKFTPENVIATARSPSGQVVFLETGNTRAGLQHIIGQHANDFASIGVSQAEIPNVVMQAVSQGKIVGYQGVGTGRPIFETVINGQPRQLAITVSDNGFIVGANPRGSLK
jgi:filamentous hemagglutinin